MDNKTATDLLDRMPIERSNYEFRNFNLELYGSFPRQLRAMLLEREQLNDEMVDLQAQIDLLAMEAADAASSTEDKAKQEVMARGNLARKNQMNRALTAIKQKLAQVNDWLDGQDIDQCREAATKFEDHESEYWSDLIGRNGAIDLLAVGRTRPDTMQRMSQLPLADFKKTVMVISQMANFLKDTTQQAEAALFPSQDQIPGSTSGQE